MKRKLTDRCPRCGEYLYNCGCRDVCESPGCFFTRMVTP